MNDLALGGALDDWSFVVSSIATAATVAAVWVALSLARRADRQSRRADADALLRDASQVVTVLRPGVTIGGQQIGPGPVVETFNGSRTAITALDVSPVMSLPQGHVGSISFAWHGTHDGKSPYVAQDKPIYMMCRFIDPENPERVSLPDGLIADQAMSFIARWRDATGQRWERRDNGEPTRI